MQLNTRVRLDAARRGREACRRPGLSPAIGGILGKLDGLLDVVRRLLHSQLNAREIEADARSTRARLGPDLAERLTDLLRLARAVGQQERIDALRLFPRYPAHSPGPFLAGSRDILERITLHQDLLLHHGLPTALLPQLRRDIEAYATASTAIQQAEKAYADAGAELDQTARTAYDLIEHLDALLHLELRTEPEFFKAWDKASAIQWPHVRRRPSDDDEDDATERPAAQ